MNKNAFTLIEIMIVIAIIGLLASLAIPNFMKFQMKSKTTECKRMLSAIRTAEEAYKSENNVYSTNMDSLGVGITGANRYSYTIETTANSFTASCSAIFETGTTDGWYINQQSKIVHYLNEYSI